jgi:BirA family biotin operon repressor/biotin-[acetyl-CoA-carboxylase] ligase
MKRTEFFRILDSVGSTNNYAMAELHAGMARHGMAWFAREQTAGKGQRGKKWASKPGENITMSIVIEPGAVFSNQSFLFNMAISNACYDFLNSYCKNEIKIKWPNDIYICDRKAAGILIENIYRGNIWKWAVVGVGVNINQLTFPDSINNATSLKKITGFEYDAIRLGKELYQMLLHSVGMIKRTSLPEILKNYNRNLFMINEKAKLRKENIVFETTIKGVNDHGQLLTEDSISRQFNFGEVEWVL